MMWKVYVGNLDSRVKERELADEFRTYGNVRSVWVARNPPGYAFVEFDDRRDAEESVSALDGKHGWRVEMSRKSVGGGGRSRGSSESRCYDCGGIGHFARECRSRGSRYPRRRSPSPLYRRSGSHRHSLTRSGHDGSRSPRRDRSSSYRDRSSPRRKRERSRSLDSDISEGRGHRTKVHRDSMSPQHAKSDAFSPEMEDNERNRSPKNDPEEKEHEQNKSPDNGEAEHELNKSPDNGEAYTREDSPSLGDLGAKSPVSVRSGQLGDIQKEESERNGAHLGDESYMERDGSPVLRDDSKSPQPENVGSNADRDGSLLLRDDNRSPQPKNSDSYDDRNGSLRADSMSPQPENIGSYANRDGSPSLRDGSRSPQHEKVDSYADRDGSPISRGDSRSSQPENIGFHADSAMSNGTIVKSPEEDNNGCYPDRNSTEELVGERHNGESD